MNQLKALIERTEYRDGSLYWVDPPHKCLKVGTPVGSLSSNGYVKTNTKGKDILLHRAIFFAHHGYLPEFIDHINGDKADNRIENLRPATKAENTQNSKKQNRNTSGYKNVHFHKSKWRVMLTIDGAQKTIGRFDDVELADLVAQEARNKYHKGFSRHV